MSTEITGEAWVTDLMLIEFNRDNRLFRDISLSDLFDKQIARFKVLGFRF